MSNPLSQNLLTLRTSKIIKEHCLSITSVSIGQWTSWEEHSGSEYPWKVQVTTCLAEDDSLLIFVGYDLWAIVPNAPTGLLDSVQKHCLRWDIVDAYLFWSKKHLVWSNNND